jgi:hypothetical protein
MDPVQTRLAIRLQKGRSTHIGGQHALLDQAVRIVTMGGHDPFDLALVIEDHHRLDRLEVDRAALAARLTENLKQAIQRLQAWLQGAFPVAFRLRRSR